MKNLILTLLLLPLCIAAQAVAAGRVNLDSLYRCLDAAIDSSRHYVSIRQNRIHRLKDRLNKATARNTRYGLSFALYEEYRSFMNDSAVVYLNRCVALAARMGDRKRENDCLARLAFQCSTTGMYPESMELLGVIDTTQLDRAGMRNYLIAGQHLYSEMSYYTNVPWLRQKYAGMSQEFLRKMYATLPSDDEECLLHREMDLYNRGDLDGAISVNDRWMKMVKRGSHRYAIAAFYRFLAYNKMGNDEETMRWLAESALSDIRLAVMDQGSLWELANRLSDDPSNLQRAYKYIKFSWSAARMFNTRVRSNQISPVLSLIEGNYQEHIARVNMRQRIIIGVVCVLLIVVAGLFLYVNRQRRKLQTARNELDTSNRELTNLNTRLSEYVSRLNVLNEKLASANHSLDESNKMKEVYIGRFLSLCSAYIDKTETLRHNIEKRVKNKDYAGLARIAAVKPDNRDDFYRNFDSAFLKLFPDFVTDFNSLLRPDRQVSVSADGSLGTSLRIFALIRLGIDDSSRIAGFLHYSVNTIYNYRAKIKNSAKEDRGDFERRVKEIGMKQP